MLKTQAYEEITNGCCPLADNVIAVQNLLDYLVTKNALTKKQRNQLSPKLNQLELSHYHGLPKPYKVNLFQLIYYSLYCFSFFSYRLKHHYVLLLQVCMHQQHWYRNF
jgi:hypothetical protein